MSDCFRLKYALLRNKSAILDAMIKDYAMASSEAEMFEYNPVIMDIDNTIKNLRHWAEGPLDMTAEDFGKIENI